MSLVDFILEYMTRTEMRLDDYYWIDILEVLGLIAGIFWIVGVN